MLSNISDNRLYKTQTIRVKVKQNLETKSLKDIKLISFEPDKIAFNQAKYDELARKGKEAW